MVALCFARRTRVMTFVLRAGLVIGAIFYLSPLRHAGRTGMSVWPPCSVY